MKFPLVCLVTLLEREIYDNRPPSMVKSVYACDNFYKFFMQTWQRLMRDKSWPALSVSADGSALKD